MRGTVSDEKMQELRKNAPCPSFVNSAQSWSTAIKRPEDERLVQPVYWTKSEERWQFHQGILSPSRNGEEVVLAVSSLPQLSDVIEESCGVMKNRGLLRAPSCRHCQENGHEGGIQFWFEDRIRPEAKDRKTEMLETRGSRSSARLSSLRSVFMSSKLELSQNEAGKDNSFAWRWDRAFAIFHGFFWVAM